MEQVEVKKMSGIYRVVIAGTRKIAKGKLGDPRDQGGYQNEKDAKRYANAVNAGLKAAAARRKRKKAA